MKLIKSSYEIVDIQPRAIAIPDDMELGPKKIKGELINTIFRQIEAAGRTCYKSEDKITETSAQEFVNRMVNSEHYAMLEFGTVYLTIPIRAVDEGQAFTDLYLENPYCKVCTKLNAWYVTTNYRVLVENKWLEDLQYLCEPTQYHERRVCARFITDRGVSHELVRHRVFSFAQESTRRIAMAA